MHLLIGPVKITFWKSHFQKFSENDFFKKWFSLVLSVAIKIAILEFFSNHFRTLFEKSRKKGQNSQNPLTRITKSVVKVRGFWPKSPFLTQFWPQNLDKFDNFGQKCDKKSPFLPKLSSLSRFLAKIWAKFRQNLDKLDNFADFAGPRFAKIRPKSEQKLTTPLADDNTSSTYDVISFCSTSSR